MHYHFKIHKEGKGYWAECVELEGCVTQADTKKELWENMEEALDLYLEEPKDSSYLAPLPKRNIKKSPSIVEVLVDPEIAFAFLLRHFRIKSKMTQEQVAKELGYPNIYSYQRLERRCNPTLETMSDLKELFPDLSVDYVLS